MSNKGPVESEPTENIISLAHDGYKFARLLKNGREYVGLPGKFRSTHKIRCHRIEPKYITKDVPSRVVRLYYDDPKNFVEYPNTQEGRESASNRMQIWKELAKNAAPTSAVAIPRTRAYKNFVQRRTEAAKDGSLYVKDSRTKNNMAKKAPKAPSKNAGGPRNADNKNGVSRPKDGTLTGKVWDIADKCDGERAAVIKEGTKRNINIATITTQLGKWRKYHGLIGRSAPAAKKAPAKKKPAPPKAKKAPAKAPEAPAEVGTN